MYIEYVGLLESPGSLFGQVGIGSLGFLEQMEGFFLDPAEVAILFGQHDRGCDQGDGPDGQCKATDRRNG